MNILVTGGSGFLGSHIADVLVERGHRVTIFDRVDSSWRGPEQSLVLGDLRDADAVMGAAKDARAEAIYHLGGFADLNAAKSRPVDTVHANVVGTVNLLEAARTLEVKRFVFASTVYVYSHAGGFYRCSKQACEAYIEEYARSYGLAFTIVRYGSLYGPRSNHTNGIYRLLAEAMRHGTLRYGGSPDDRREYIHVEDAARLSADILADEFRDRHMLLTGNTALRAAELFTMFSEILGRRIEVAYDEHPPGASGHYSMTPYTYTPKPGRKLTTNDFVDMGQGLLQLVERLHLDTIAESSNE